MEMTPANRDRGWSMVLESLTLPGAATLVSGSWQILRVRGGGVLGQVGPWGGTQDSQDSLDGLIPLLGSFCFLLSLRKGRLRHSVVIYEEYSLVPFASRLHAICIPCWCWAEMHRESFGCCLPRLYEFDLSWLWVLRRGHNNKKKTLCPACLKVESTAKRRLVTISVCSPSLFLPSGECFLYTLCLGVRVRMMMNLH